MARDYDKLLDRLTTIAESPAVNMKRLGMFVSNERSYEIVAMELGACAPGKHRVMIAAGIHGDEPAGVEAAVRFLEQNASNEEFLSRFYIVIFPCNNPAGYELATRENADRIDLNREFNARKPAPEAAIIMRALEGRCFDLVFEMHEDIDSPGLYLYEICNDPSQYVGEKIIEAAAAMNCPINENACIEGMPANGGLIRRRVIRFRKTRVPQAIYTYRTCGGHVITMEPPASVLPFEDRVRIELRSLDIALGSLPKREYI